MAKPSVASLQAQLVELRGELKEARSTQRASIQGRSRDTEVLDPTPIEIPAGMERPPSIQEMIQQYVQGSLSAQAQEDGYGSFEEEDDFEPDVDDELPLLSGFEVHEMDEEPFIDEPEAQEAAPPPEPVEGLSEAPAASSETEPAPGPENAQ